jgi:hypothetical protein
MFLLSHAVILNERKEYSHSQPSQTLALSSFVV